MKNICSSILKISQQVSKALKDNKPVVALQSTIISHGMPYPQNKQCAQSIENIIKQNGAIPATIAIFDGSIYVGLQKYQIQKLAFTGKSISKVSRRDLPIILAKKGIGATTVSATMIAAYAAGINLFVTGGIGGVHRGYENTMDVSADLQQLGRTPITVISAGVKSILDISRTLQYLQTKGVSVITYKNKYFPAFFSQSSQFLSPFFQTSLHKIAQIIYQHQKIGLANGILVAVPNNKPKAGYYIEEAIQKALKQSQDKGIKGAQITPFLMKKVNQLTKGKTLQANISLIHNNAKVGARIAVQLNKLKKQKKNSFSYSTTKNKIIVIGGSAVDYRMLPAPGRNFQFHKSCIATSMKTIGGVGRNIAQVCAKLGISTIFITILGNDEDGVKIRQSCQYQNLQFYSIFTKKQTPTSRYFALLDSKNNQIMGISEMHINDQLTFDNVYKTYFKKKQKQNTNNDIVIIDANFNENSLRKMVQFCSQMEYFVVYEAKGQKSKKIIESKAYKWVNLIKMNKIQKQQLISAIEKVQTSKQTNQWLAKEIGSKNKCKRQYTNIHSITTSGQHNIQIIAQNKIKHIQVKKPQNVKKTTGAGDTFTGAFCTMLLKGKSTNQSLKYGIVASKINVEEQVNVGSSIIAKQLNLTKLEKQYQKIYQ